MIIQIKAIEQYQCSIVVLFDMLCKVILTMESVDETLLYNVVLRLSLWVES